MKIFDKFTALTLLVMLFASCTGNDSEAGLPSDNGNTLQVHIDTRSVTPGDGYTSDGGGMNSLWILVVDNDGEQAVNLVRRIEKVTLNGVTSHTFSFDNVTLGSYSIYAFANVETSSQNVRTLLSGSIGALAVGDEFDASHYDMTFAQLQGDHIPDVEGEIGVLTDMLLTARKDINISYGSNSVTVEMMRPLVNFRLHLRNNSDRAMRVLLPTVSFSAFNPTTGYVIAHNGEIPSTVEYHKLPKYSGAVSIPAGNVGSIYDVYIYENRAPEYSFGMEVQVASEAIDSYNGALISYIDAGQTYYLYNNNGTPAVQALTTAPTGNDYIWNFVVTEGDGVYKLQNVGNGMYLSLIAGNMHLVTPRNASSLPITGRLQSFTDDATLESTDINVPDFTGGNSVTVQSVISRMSTPKAVYLAGVNGALALSENTMQWNISATTAYSDGWQTFANVADRKIKVVEAGTSQAVDMTEMLRNQRVTVLVNAYYNDTTAEFEYELEAWKEIANEVVFE